MSRLGPQPIDYKFISLYKEMGGSGNPLPPENRRKNNIWSEASGCAQHPTRKNILPPVSWFFGGYFVRAFVGIPIDAAKEAREFGRIIIHIRLQRENELSLSLSVPERERRGSIL